MWNLVLALAGGLFVSVLGALVRGLFSRVPNSVKVVALVVLGLVIAIAASETWRCAAFTVVEGNRTSTLLAVMVLLAIGVIAFLVDQRTALRRELEETRHEREELRARFGVNAPTTVDYIGAGGIVDGYISPKLQGMREIHRISVRRNFLERFDRVTGAKLGEHKYNRALLHQWMQSNAARFLVEHRHEMS